MNPDRLIKQAIVGAVIGGWLLSVAMDCYLSFKAGTLSATLQDVIKQGLTALIGFLVKTGLDHPDRPIEVTNPIGETLDVHPTEPPISPSSEEQTP